MTSFPTEAVKISELPALATPGSTDALPIVNSGITKQTPPGALSTDWKSLPATLSAITYNGNRSYTFTTSTDVSAFISNGMRLRTTRTIAAPTRCTSLNGTTQYYSRPSANLGSTMVWTDDFASGIWVKMTAYQAGTVISRFNNTSGWQVQVDGSGRPSLYGFNAGAGNNSGVIAYQSLPLNRWVYLGDQLDMSAFTATTTTSYIMIDGVDVPCTVSRAGTNPTALVQAGNLEIGGTNGGTVPFAGKIAQVFVSSAKITQANMRTLMSQGLTSALITANSIVSAYSFDNSIADLNTTSANNLTANGSAVATSTDSPFGIQADGSISSSLDYAIVHGVTSSSLTVQVPEGGSIPTSGGVSAVAYATVDIPYGFPRQKNKWSIVYINKSSNSSAAVGGVSAQAGYQMTAPVGSWLPYFVGTIEIAGALQPMGTSVAISDSSTALNYAVSEPVFVYIDKVSQFDPNVRVSGELAAASATILYVVLLRLTANTTTQGINAVSGGGARLVLDNAYV